MGLFDKIKNVVKDIGSGVKKVFEKVTAFMGKVFGSKLGKILLIAAAVVTGGMALYGAFTGAASAMGGLAQTATFMDKFLVGAQGFLKGGMAGFKAAGTMFGQAAGGDFAGAMNTFTGVGEAGAAAGTSVAQAFNAANPMAAPPGGVPTGGVPTSGVQEAAATGTHTNASGFQLNAQGPAQIPGTYDAAASLQPSVTVPGMAPPDLGGGGLLKAAQQVPTEPGFLSKLGTAIKDTVASPTGLIIGGQMAKGYAAGKEAEEEARRKKQLLANSAWQQGATFHPEQHIIGYGLNPWAPQGVA